MSNKLFRQEAIDAQRERFLGDASLARPVPLWVFTLLAAGAAALLLVIAVWGQYQRRERVEGFLEIDAGAARVLIPSAGRVSELRIKEGDEVAAGAPMAVISYDKATATGSSTSAAIADELKQRRALLEREQAQLKELGEQQVAQVRKRVADLQNEITQLDREVKLQEQRLASAKEQAQRFQKLAAEKFVSDLVARQKADDATDQEIRLQALKRQRATLDRDLSAARLDEPAVALKSRSQVDQLSRQLSELSQTETQEASRRENLIRAPIAGTVTNIAVNAGQSVADDALLATVMPKGGGLHAELLVPTRAIGFVAKGQEVMLRYEAFPFERFGQYRGTVKDISRTVWSPGEKLGPSAIREPVYRVTVQLERQTVSALGQEIPLRSGMLVNADLLLEKRSLLEWMFEPVLKIKGRL
ncbi:MAG: HlyD family efflux transporter periplasmic adaptor subunit [Burkholderiales bacterium]|nr:HlyD family efflux transporter periplasmic adaptor subunit [Burkholderiales bacterium]